ncbi:MAG: transposase [Mesorhizobium sp.]|nr:MAG: transposase [Mesorhizobium sp.]RWI63326.1 MAG: transposase [Mesorhizobium sp.]
MPPLPTRLMARARQPHAHLQPVGRGAVCALDREPYFQYLCGEEFFRHELPFDRSSMTRWRSRMGEERIAALLQESLAVAVKTGAMKPQDTRRVIVDTTVQPKNVMFPTDAKRFHRARERLVRLARKAGLDLRQSYVRVGKRALIMYQRYAHANSSSGPTKPCAGSGPIWGAPSGTSPPDHRRGGARGHLPLAALPGLDHSGAQAAPARPQDLEHACAGGRVHW